VAATRCRQVHANRDPDLDALAGSTLGHDDRMPSPFSMIIAGELPARFLWQDDDVVSFLTIAPIRPGHALVVPRAEVDHWQHVDPALLGHCMDVAQKIAQAQQKVWDSPRVALVIAGLEVPHLHLHVIPMWRMSDMDFSAADHDPDPADLDDAADQLRGALADLGYA
jgi:diadenosine tetraphosphate (Ap4A) HIT family hydrolase